jgi:SAM-dependent methyltransferase
MISDRLFTRFYGDPKYNGTLTFYAWIRQYTKPSTRLLNLGTGPPTSNKIRQFKGEVAEVVGADIDPIVLENSELDSAVVIENGRIPLPDSSFDIVLSDYVLEHVENPAQYLTEVSRILRPGGSFFFRTPNLFHYVTAASALTPHWVHKAIANRVRGLSAEAHEPWRTHYRMNTRFRLQRLAAAAGYTVAEIRTIECEPSYLMFHPAAFFVGLAYERIVNSAQLLSVFRANILGRFVR